MINKMLPVSKKPVKSLKNRNLEAGLLLQKMFSFSYAGKCEIFINKRYKSFELIHKGVHIVQDIYTFSPNYIARFKFETLYQAILAFNKCVKIVTSSMDWFSPELFQGSDIYDEIFLKD